MARIRNTFEKGRMEQDLDSRLVPVGVYRNALNVRVSSSSQDDVGVVENSLSNKRLTNLNLGTNAFTLGMYMDNVGEAIYWFVVSDTGRYVIEYDIDNQATSFVLQETIQTVLNFNRNNLITGVNVVVDSDNNRRFLLWNDNLNPPRQINIERAKTYGLNNFNNTQISLIKPPPLAPPTFELVMTPEQGAENNIQERFIRFAYRYQYLDGEYSALSPFTEVAFLPGTFQYDYSTQSNESMINAFNQANVTINTGSDLIRAVDLVFKDDNSNTVYIVDHYIKAETGWADNTNINIAFVNNKIFRALDADQLLRLYDAVPLKAQAQEIINNRLIFGNYTENYNLVSPAGDLINILFSLSLVTTPIVPQVSPNRSLKSNRDLEIGIVYFDLQGRMSTVLTSDANTIYIPNTNSVTRNQIRVTIENFAPAFAHGYRFFIKQTRIDYDTLVPTVFYNDGAYVWVLLQGNEVNKVNVGEFIYVKADTEQILPRVVQTRVLEIKTQDANFLNNGNTQIAGTYMRVRPQGYSLNEGDYEIYNFDSYDNTRNRYDNPVRSLQNVIELAVYYGINGLNDLTSSGTYTGNADIRYIVRIFSTGAPDTFEWSNDNGATYNNNGGVGFPITGAAQTLEQGVQVTFGNTTGHMMADNWIVSAKSSSDNNIGGDENSKAYAIYKGLPSNGNMDLNNINKNDQIIGGSQIIISYRETGETSINETRTYIASRNYDNLEEWWFRDNIQDTFFRSSDDIWFRRGTVGQTSGAAKFFTQDAEGDMTLLIRSAGTQNNDVDNIIKVYSEIDIISLAQIVLFETIPQNNNSEFFYEIGKTYLIDENRNHLGNGPTDVNQTATVPGQMTLDVANCFCWGNGFESYKIKDLFNATNFKVSGTRPLSTIEDYRENVRIASLTYGKVYQQTTNFNGLNEFNLSTANFKDLDDRYESIQKLYSRDTNLIVFQEDKILRIPYTKDLLFTAQGDPNVTQSTEILGTETAYAGEYGISKNPESFAQYGNAIYFTDARRAVVCRLDLNGIIEISQYGMTDFFEDRFRQFVNNKKLGAYDLYNKQYVLTVDETPNTVPPRVACNDIVYLEGITAVYTYQLELNNLGGDVILPYVITIGAANISAVFNSNTYQTGTVTGSGNLQFTRDSLTESIVTVTITPVTQPLTIQVSNTCPVGTALDVIVIITNTEAQQGRTMTSRYKWGSSGFFSEIPEFEADGITLFQTYSGVEGQGRFPFNGSNIEMQAYKDASNDGEFGEQDSSLGFLVSSTNFSEADIATIKAQATFPTLQIINEGNIPETRRVNFTFNRATPNERLYLLWDYSPLVISENTYIYIYFDSSGSMDSTLAPLQTMRDTLLKDALLPFYNNDPDLYDQRVVIIEQSNERTMDMLNGNGAFPPGSTNLVSLVFQDEASTIYMPSQNSFDPNAPRTAQYDTDIGAFRTRLASFTPDYYRGIIFQVIPNSGTGFQTFLQAVQNGTGNYAVPFGLSDKTEVLFKYDITDGGTPQYYLDQVTAGLTELGFDLNP